MYNISGWIQGCLALYSLEFSTLQCLYADSDCFPLLLNYLAQMTFMFIQRQSLSVEIHPLVYNHKVSGFPPNTPISIIIKQLMVEQWNPSLSYEHFYEACAPAYCSYSQSVHQASFIGVIIKLVSLTGGIVASLRILTPHLVKSFLRFLTVFKKKPKPKKPEQGNHFK